ncbi:MAG: hypothetical protein KAS32_29720 [Candidatus Peribacteraceae bacterium]|nr:hypothetical protein [Candidatus Peribacteraceae bacterium]
MAEELENAEVAPENAGEQAASVEVGEAVGTEASQGGESTTPESPTYDGMTGESLHKSYKEMQADYTKMKQAVKALDEYGGLDGTSSTLAYLRGNDDFHKFVEAQRNKDAYGFDQTDMEPDQKSAIDLVEKISSKSVSDAMDKVIAERLAPLEKKIKETSLNKVFSGMDDKYPEWRGLQDVMGDLAERLSPEVYSDPGFEDVEALYHLALSKAGKFDDYAAKRYQHMLEQKKKNDTGKPAAHAGASEPGRARTMREALAMAKEQMA